MVSSRDVMAPERTVIGVDIGGTKVAAALVRGRLPAPGARSRAEVETPEILDRFTDAHRRRARPRRACAASRPASPTSSTARATCEGIGVGVASMVDFAGGRVVESVNLPLADVPLRDLLQRALRRARRRSTTTPRRRHRRARLRRRRGHARDAHAHAGHGRGRRHHQRRPPVCAGLSGAAAEIGHIIIDVNGPKCPANCPNHGCLEAYVAGPAMGAAALAAARARARLGPRPGPGGRARPSTAGCSPGSALEGDAGAVAVLERAGEYLGAGLVTLANIFDPELIVIGGGAAAAGELLLAPARRVLAARAPAAGARPGARRAGGARPRRRLHRRGGAGAHRALPRTATALGLRPRRSARSGARLSS